MNDGALFGFHVTPLTRRRFHNFRANKRGYWSLWIFLALLFTSLFAELIAKIKKWNPFGISLE